MKEVISVSAPGKLMLFGEHAVVYGRPCIVTAVDQRLSCDISFIDKKTLDINSPDVGIENYSKPLDDLGSSDNPKGVRFIELAVKNFAARYPLETGIEIRSRSEFKHTFGFGSSSAVTVCVVKGLAELLELSLSEKEIFDISYKTILDVQGKGSGFDIAAAIFGGTIYFQNAGEVIDSLDIPEGFDLVVGYSGVKADTIEMV